MYVYDNLQVAIIICFYACLVGVVWSAYGSTAGFAMGAVASLFYLYVNRD